MKLGLGRRYGLIGENGVGKSTLLRRLARQSIPGVPLHFRFGYVQQELPLPADANVLDYILRGAVSTEDLQDTLYQLHVEETTLENLMEGEDDTEKVSMLAEQLCELAERIEDVESRMQQQAAKNSDDKNKSAEAITRVDLESLGCGVVEILDGLGLSKPLKRLSLPVSELSGGWRMRAALAQCLCNMSSIDCLLLDEPTNHLDLPTVSWLQRYLATKLQHHILLFVSHDRSFLGKTATDIIEMKDMNLHYFAGSYEDYLRNQQELGLRTAHALDTRHRKEAHIQKSIDTANARGDDRTAKTKQKKLERAAFTRTLDGHRFKLMSLSEMSEDGVKHPEIIDASRGGKDMRGLRLQFPAVESVTSLRLVTPTAPLLTLDKATLTYPVRDDSTKPVLQQVTLQLNLRSRVGIVGRNGRGKSTLLKILAGGEYGQQVVVPRGTAWRHHNLRVGVIAQHQIDLLAQCLEDTPVQYLRRVMEKSGGGTSLTSVFRANTGGGDAEVDNNKESGDDDHQYRALLGSCGLGGSVALQPIGSLSGGQKARLSFAVAASQNPHILLLDEPSNHLSMEAIDALASACRDFQGGIVIVSHNKGLLQAVCDELFLLQANGTVSVRKATVATPEDEEMKRDAFRALLDAAIEEQMRS